MAVGNSESSAANRRRSSGWVPKWNSAEPIELQVVSIPAINSRLAIPTTSLIRSTPSGMSAARYSESLSSRGSAARDETSAIRNSRMMSRYLIRSLGS